MTPDRENPWSALSDSAVSWSRQSLAAGNPCEAIDWLKNAPLTPEWRAVEAQARYRFASEMIVQRRFDDAETQLRRTPRDSSINSFQWMLYQQEASNDVIAAR